ncbi:hypothetical protein FACS1894186_6310 [Alphaproteobacteria bacterium]|nr:hypothetical protein FACS1894186_6310 [Alphaproteobacteria bacterium]
MEPRPPKPCGTERLENPESDDDGEDDCDGEAERPLTIWIRENLESDPKIFVGGYALFA